MLPTSHEGRVTQSKRANIFLLPRVSTKEHEEEEGEALMLVSAASRREDKLANAWVVLFARPLPRHACERKERMTCCIHTCSFSFSLLRQTTYSTRD
jgi:hypothetical protein